MNSDSADFLAKRNMNTSTNNSLNLT